MSGQTLRIKINPGKLDQVAKQFHSIERAAFIRFVNAVDAEKGRDAKDVLGVLTGNTGARFVLALLVNGFASCDELEALLRGPES